MIVRVYKGHGSNINYHHRCVGTVNATEYYNRIGPARSVAVEFLSHSDDCSHHKDKRALIDCKWIKVSNLSRLLYG